MSINSDSISKSGFGNGFVSKFRRFIDLKSLEYIYEKVKQSPGPGHYNPLNKKNSTSSTSFSGSQTTAASTPKKQYQ